MRNARAGALLALATMVAALLPTAALASTGPTTAVLLVLRPMDAAKLQALAADHATSRAKRTSELAALAPTGGRRAVVANAATALGLDIARTASWSVRVRGAATRVTALF